MFNLYFICFTYFLIATDVVRSNPGYQFNYEAGGWLKLHATPATWEEAYISCHDEGAVLASPLNKELATALLSQMTQNSVWGHLFLGIHDLYSKGDYVSVEGVPLSEMKIKFSPQSYGADPRDCLTLSADGQAHYSSCKEPLPFVCYKKLGNQTMNECGTFDNDYHLNNNTGSCYKVHYEKESWTRAYRVCAAEGGYLVILNDDFEAYLIKDMFPPRTERSNPWDRFHVGLGAWGKERVWTTIHGERIKDVYNKWNPGQPDNGDGIQNRGSILWSGKLDDVSVEGVDLMFVCEKSPKIKQFEDLSPCTDKFMSLCNACDEPPMFSESEVLARSGFVVSGPDS